MFILFLAFQSRTEPSFSSHLHTSSFPFCLLPSQALISSDLASIFGMPSGDGTALRQSDQNLLRSMEGFLGELTPGNFNADPASFPTSRDMRGAGGAGLSFFDGAPSPGATRGTTPLMALAPFGNGAAPAGLPSKPQPPTNVNMSNAAAAAAHSKQQLKQQQQQQSFNPARALNANIAVGGFARPPMTGAGGLGFPGEFSAPLLPEDVAMRVGAGASQPASVGSKGGGPNFPPPPPPPSRYAEPPPPPPPQPQAMTTAGRPSNASGLGSSFPSTSQPQPQQPPPPPQHMLNGPPSGAMFGRGGEGPFGQGQRNYGGAGGVSPNNSAPSLPVRSIGRGERFSCPVLSMCSAAAIVVWSFLPHCLCFFPLGCLSTYN